MDCADHTEEPEGGSAHLVPVPLRTGPAVALPAASPRPRWLPLPLLPPQINAGEGTIFSAWHPDAEQYYNNSGMDLAFVFNQMTDTHRRYNTVITHGQAASKPAFASANDWGPALLAVLLFFILKGAQVYVFGRLSTDSPCAAG